MVFDVSGPVRYEQMVLSNPDRVVVDLADAKLAEGFVPGIDAAKHERIENMRMAPRGSGHRLVLDLTRPLKPNVFALEPAAPHGYRLVIDLHDQARPAPKPSPEAQNGLRDVVIAVDAGHGGDDPGAIGVNKVYEKRVVLSIARKLAARFNDTAGYRAVLVRKGDYYIALRRRTAIARDVRADFFVSIHADAFKSPKASGASVYALSNRGASSETARWLAEKENSSDLIGGVGNARLRLGDKDPLLRQVLLDMSMDAKLEGSIEAGKSVLRELGKVAKLHSRTVEQAGFVVLKSPDIPSLLIETGYLSNPLEARRLDQADHQNRLVRAIHAGLRAYLESAPPPGTLLAQHLAEGKRRYTIVRGDTLSEIAVRYGTSAERIRRANGLRGDRIRAGQVILIPAQG